MEAERKARESVARGIVLGLGDTLDDLGISGGDADEADSDPLSSVSDSLDSLLA